MHRCLVCCLGWGACHPAWLCSPVLSAACISLQAWTQPKRSYSDEAVVAWCKLPLQIVFLVLFMPAPCYCAGPGGGQPVAASAKPSRSGASPSNPGWEEDETDSLHSGADQVGLRQLLLACCSLGQVPTLLTGHCAHGTDEMLRPQALLWQASLSLLSAYAA